MRHYAEIFNDTRPTVDLCECFPPGAIEEPQSGADDAVMEPQLLSPKG